MPQSSHCLHSLRLQSLSAPPFSQALHIDPTHADSLCALALLLMRHRNLAGAEDHYRRALEVGGPRRPRSFTCSESLL